MDQQQLKRHLEMLSASLSREDSRLLKARLEALSSVYPFNEYEYIISFLIDKGILSFSEYERLRERYVSSNRYLELFELSPRVFGQIWAEKHLRDLDHRFQKPSRAVDPDFDGEYDLWFEGIKVEVKASRAIHAKKRGALIARALHWGDQAPFWMNFQQLKLDTCDVFVFIGVWVDKLVYWVLSTQEIASDPFLSHQHRGGVEYQIGVTDKNIAEFERYRVAPDRIGQVILQKAAKKD